MSPCINSYIAVLGEGKSAFSQTGELLQVFQHDRQFHGIAFHLTVTCPPRSDTELPPTGTFRAGCVPEERFPWWTVCVTFLPLYWHSLHLETSGRMGRSEFVCLFGFRYTFPCLGWARALPLSCSQIRIINWSNFWLILTLEGRVVTGGFLKIYTRAFYFFIWHKKGARPRSVNGGNVELQ